MLIDKTGSVIVVGTRMFIQGGANYDPALGDAQFKMTMDGKSGRKKYMRLLTQTLDDPDEIWVSWETVKNNPVFPGQKILVRHFLKGYIFTDDDGKERFLMTVARKSRHGWFFDAVTAFHSERESYFEGMRRGFLAYSKK